MTLILMTWHIMLGLIAKSLEVRVLRGRAVKTWLYILVLLLMYPAWETNKQLLKMAIEIVDLPIKNGDFPVRYVSLPEGN